jgi:hypothetical protein
MRRPPLSSEVRPSSTFSGSPKRLGQNFGHADTRSDGATLASETLSSAMRTVESNGRRAPGCLVLTVRAIHILAVRRDGLQETQFDSIVSAQNVPELVGSHAGCPESRLPLASFDRLLASSNPDHGSGFRFLAASTRVTTFTGDVSSASRISNSVSRVGDFRYRSSWLV